MSLELLGSGASPSDTGLGAPEYNIKPVNDNSVQTVLTPDQSAGVMGWLDDTRNVDPSVLGRGADYLAEIGRFAKSFKTAVTSIGDPDDQPKKSTSPVSRGFGGAISTVIKNNKGLVIIAAGALALYFVLKR